MQTITNASVRKDDVVAFKLGYLIIGIESIYGCIEDLSTIIRGEVLFVPWSSGIVFSPLILCYNHQYFDKIK